MNWVLKIEGVETIFCENKPDVRFDEVVSITQLYIDNELRGEFLGWRDWILSRSSASTAKKEEG